MADPNKPYTTPAWLKRGELVLDGALFRAPLSKDIETVLDIGSGTGTWAGDFAREFQQTQVIATDITPIMSINSVSNPNVTCLIEDAASTWSQPDNSVDYVHIRYLVGSIPDWDALFREAFRVLKPGGYVESLEPSPSFQSDDGTVEEGSPLDQWGKMFNAGGRKIGRSFEVVGEDLQRKGIVNAGFESIVMTNFKVPISPWPKDKRLAEIGRCFQMTMEQDVEGYVLFLFNSVMGWTVEEVEAYAADVLSQVHDETIHAYFWARNVYGQKPTRKPDADEGEGVSDGYVGKGSAGGEDSRDEED
ncbi:methyltransferase domain-containing protein [Podospora conica]|nr:methyltransferase domain-containing protein [Schizothecium conicum]